MRCSILPFVLLTLSLPAQDPPDFTGLWQGRLTSTHLALEIEAGEGGRLRATLYNLSRGAQINRAVDPRIVGEELRMRFPRLGGELRGRRRSGAKGLQMRWLQGGQATPLRLEPSAPIDLVERRKRFVLPAGMNPRAPMETAQFAFLVGEWEGRTVRRGGRPARDPFVLTWSGSWALDGMAVQNVSRTTGRPGTKAAGTVIQHGLDLRIYNPVRGVWEHSYTDAIQGCVLRIEWQAVAQGLSSKPVTWLEGGRPTLNRIHFREIGAARFVWAFDRSLDGGKTWIKDFQVVENRRRK